MAPFKRTFRYWRYHGYYCGPGWSDGKYQKSKCGYSTATDAFDQTCKDHDCAYHKGKNLKKADYKFYKQNIGKGFKRKAAAIAVGIQGATRSSSFPEKDIVMSRSRSRSTPSPRGRSPKRRALSLPPTPRARSNVTMRTASRSTTRSRSRSTARTARSRRSNNISVPAHNRVVGHTTRLLPASKLMKYGVQTCTETGGIVTSDYCRYIGHATCPNGFMKRTFWRALLKNLLIRISKLNPVWDATPLDFGVTDTIVIKWRPQMGSATADSFQPFAYVAQTQEELAIEMHNYFISAQQQFEIIGMFYKPLNLNPGSYYVDLKNARVTMDCVSTFKMQNQSVTITADDEADNVNNVPLVGKVYEGRGTGTRWVGGTASAVPFICDPLKGIINKDGITNQLAEPPSAKLFEQVTGSGKVSIAPGEVVTSKLHYQKEVSLQHFITLVWDFTNETAPNNYKMKYNGSFKIYALEKLIEFQLASAEGENEIKIAYEHDLKMSVMLTPKQTHYTTTLYEGAIV